MRRSSSPNKGSIYRTHCRRLRGSLMLSAATGAVVWSRHLAAPVPSGSLPCGDIAPTVGITGTPVIDPARGEIFVVTDRVVSQRPAHVLVGLSTASGRVELHIRTAASGFQSGADVATTFVVGDGGNGVFELVNGDIVFIKTRNTGSGKIEVHRVSAANLSGPPVQDAATALSSAEAGNGTLQMSGNDLVYIKTRNTGGTRVELHVVDGGTNYTTFKVHTPTVFATSDADNGVWSVRNLFSAGIGDLVFIKTRNTASGTVELFAAGAAGNYQQPNLQTSTGIGVSDGANGFFNLNLG